MLIGITGKKRHGKDESANELIKDFGFNKHGFADKVKEMLYEINPVVVLKEGLYTYSYGTRLQTVVNNEGWEIAKDLQEVRELLQRLGTEGGRKLFGEDFWVDRLFEYLIKKYDYYEAGYPLTKQLQSNIVISDVRFDNEAKKIKEYGGYIVHIDRPNYDTSIDTHASEKGISTSLVDAFVINDKGIYELHSDIKELYKIFKDKGVGINESGNQGISGIGNSGLKGRINPAEGSLSDL